MKLFLRLNFLLIFEIIIITASYGQMEPDEIKNTDFYKIKSHEVVFEYFINNMWSEPDEIPWFLDKGPGIDGFFIFAISSKPRLLTGMQLSPEKLNKIFSINLFMGNKKIDKNIKFSELIKGLKSKSEVLINYENYYRFHIPLDGLVPGKYRLVINIKNMDRKIRYGIFNTKKTTYNFTLKKAGKENIDDILIHNIYSKEFNDDNSVEIFIKDILKNKKIKDAQKRINLINYLMHIYAKNNNTIKHLSWGLVLTKLSPTINARYIRRIVHSIERKKASSYKDIEKKAKEICVEFFPDIKGSHSWDDLSEIYSKIIRQKR